MKIQMNRKLFRRKKKKIINKTVKKIRMMNRFMMKMKSNMSNKNMNKMVMLKMKNKLKIKSLILSMDWIKYKKKMIKNKME
jgi:hypothetical protein